jgi:hypothetical protein
MIWVERGCSVAHFVQDCSQHVERHAFTLRHDAKCFVDRRADLSHGSSLICQRMSARGSIEPKSSTTVIYLTRMHRFAGAGASPSDDRGANKSGPQGERDMEMFSGLLTLMHGARFYRVACIYMLAPMNANRLLDIAIACVALAFLLFMLSAIPRG